MTEHKEFYEKFIKPHMETAGIYSKLSSAKRLQCGAILVSPDNTRVLAIGYNGTPPGYSSNICEYFTKFTCESCNIVNHTTESMIYEDKYELGSSFELDWISVTNGIPICKRCNRSDKIKYEIKTKYSVIHAEENVLLYCAKNGISTNGCIMYITTSPCINCARMILSAGIKRVYYRDIYRDKSGIEFLEKCGICIEKIN